MGSLDEEQLVRLIARGDRAAFEELYRRTAPVARNLTGMIGLVALTYTILGARR